MVTEPNEFIQKLQELQDSTEVTYTTLPSDEPRFIIDANTRSITIPPEFQFLGVKNDHNAETVYFEIDRYFDDEDLSQHTCVVQFSNKNNSNDGGIYPVTTMDTTSVDGKIIFGWEIKSDATSLVGDIYFSVRFYSINSTDYVFTYNFNTLTAKSVILDTLDVDNPEIFENYPSELDAWLDRMNDLSQKLNGSGGNESSNSELIKKCEERIWALEAAPATWCGECEEVDDSGRMLVNYAWKWSSSGQTLTFDKRAVTFGDTLEILISNNLTITNNKFVINDGASQEECTITSNENDIIFPLEVKSGDVLTLKAAADQAPWFTFSKGLFTGVEKTVEELTNKIGNLTFTVDGTTLNITDGTNNWSIPAN